MDQAQAKRFYRDGYLRLPGVVPRQMALAGRRLLFERMGALRGAAREALQRGKQRHLEEAMQLNFRTAGSALLMGLFNETPVRRIVEKGMGAKTLPVMGAQLATLFPGEFGDVTNEAGYLNKDTPFNGWTGHLDGLWNGGTPPPRAGTDIRGRNLARWRSAPSTNGMFKTRPEYNCNMANFTALVGVALSDQRELGAGNLGLLRGGHKHMEAFFKQQRSLGGPLGPDGPGWERENAGAPNRHGLVHYPQAVRRKYARRSAATADGELWPEPTFMRLNVGDAVIVHALTPHAGSLVARGAEPRLMVYFRCTNGSRPEKNVRIYPNALCDALLEWRGVRRMLAR